MSTAPLEAATKLLAEELRALVSKAHQYRTVLGIRDRHAWEVCMDNHVPKLGTCDGHMMFVSLQPMWDPYDWDCEYRLRLNICVLPLYTYLEPQELVRALEPSQDLLSDFARAGELAVTGAFEPLKGGIAISLASARPSL